MQRGWDPRLRNIMGFLELVRLGLLVLLYLFSAHRLPSSALSCATYLYRKPFVRRTIWYHPQKSLIVEMNHTLLCYYAKYTCLWQNGDMSGIMFCTNQAIHLVLVEGHRDAKQRASGREGKKGKKEINETVCPILVICDRNRQYAVCVTGKTTVEAID